MKIEKSIYEGYLWYSDQIEPAILTNEEFELEITNDKNPFIIEGQLYDINKMKSISIKYVDGKYLCNEYDVNKADFNKKDITIKIYYSNRIQGKKLQFLQYWEEEPDTLCENMAVLHPKKLVFVGFINK